MTKYEELDWLYGTWKTYYKRCEEIERLMKTECSGPHDAGYSSLYRALELTEEKREKYASLFLAKMAQMTDEEGKEYEK